MCAPQSKPSQRTSRMIASTYSWLSFVGFVSSNRRWQRPPNSSASPKSRAIALAWPMWRYPFGSGGKRVTTPLKRPVWRSSTTASRMTHASRPSAAGGIGNEEPEGAARRVVLEVVPGALESRRTLEEREHGGLVGGPLTVLRLVGAHRVPDRGEGGLVGQEPCVRDRTLLLDLLDRPGGGAEVADEQKAGERHDDQHEHDLDEAEPARNGPPSGKNHRGHIIPFRAPGESWEREHATILAGS